MGENFPEEVRQLKGSDKGTDGFRTYRNAQLKCKRQCISRQNNQPLVNLNGKVDPLTKNECTVYCRRASNGNKKTNRKFCQDKNFCRKPELPLLPKLAERRGYTTLVAALNAADLVGTLEQEEPLRTLFAPTDEAFAALPAGTIEMLLKPENKQTLVKILTYHVVTGKVTAKDVAGLSDATTVEGSKVMVSTDMNKVMINDANVIKADIMTSNGVIHVIDTVLLPNDVKAAL